VPLPDRARLFATARAPSYTLDDEPLHPAGRLVVAAGELDIAAAGDLRSRLRGAIDAGATRVLLDLAGVDFIDSTSVAAIVAAHRRLAGRGRLVVVATHPYVRLIFEAAGVVHVIAICETRDEALGLLGA